jgi:hypothetical protein
MGMRLPGNIHSAESLWELLINKKETSGPFPSSRFNSDGFYSDSNMPGCIGTQRGHFLDESDGLDRLDTSFFSMGKAEVEKLDPQQRMLLEVVWECMENAGQVDWRGSNTGVFVGTWGDDWQDFLAKDPQQIGGMLNVSGAGDFAISNRVSYEYNLTGPRYVVYRQIAGKSAKLKEIKQYDYQSSMRLIDDLPAPGMPGFARRKLRRSYCRRDKPDHHGDTDHCTDRGWGPLTDRPMSVV